MRKKVLDFVRDLKVGDCVEFSVGKHIGKGKVDRVLREGRIRFVIPANTRPTRKWLMESMAIKTMTPNFTPNITYDHDTFVIAEATPRGCFLYWRPRTHHIVRVIKPRQINIFDAPATTPTPGPFSGHSITFAKHRNGETLVVVDGAVISGLVNISGGETNNGFIHTTLRFV